MNLKIKDKQGKVKAVLRDSDIEPVLDEKILQEEEDKEQELVKKDLQNIKNRPNITDIEDIKDKGE